MDLNELADRVEALAGPDRETDAQIGVAIFDGGADHVDDPRDVTRARMPIISHGARPGHFEIVGFSGVSLRSSLDYTASLEAAMMLLPESDAAVGVFWKVGNDGEGADPALFKATILMARVFTSRAFDAVADTPALALTAAALRARATL